MSNPQFAGNANLLTIAEFAHAIGKTERQVYRYINQGRLDVVSPETSGLSGIRIPGTELDRFQTHRKPSVQIVMSDTPPDMTPVTTMSQVSLERHEAALLRLGAVEKELEQARKVLTDGGHQVADLTSKVRSLELELAKNEARMELEATIRQEAEARANDLTSRLAQAETKLARRWWKLW